jgi:hypothetical protein
LIPFPKLNCRDDKKRKAFQRGGPKQPAVQPVYEKELIQKFHTEAGARSENELTKSTRLV